MIDGIDDEVARNDVESISLRMPHDREHCDARLTQDPLNHVVRSVELLRGARGAVAHDHRGAVDRRRQPGSIAHLYFGQKLRLLVEVVEPLPDIEIVFAKHSFVAAADVAGRYVVEALKRAATLGEVEHVARAFHINLLPSLARNRKVVDGGEMKDFADVADGQVERRGDVPLHDANAVAQRAGSFAGQRGKLRLYQAERRSLGRALQNAGKQLRSEKSGEAGEEDGLHVRHVTGRSDPIVDILVGTSTQYEQ